jgi:hypothetical protein
VSNVSFNDIILSDRDGNPIAQTLNGVTLNVCGFATVNGTVSLQGRATPFDAGTVILTDPSSVFGPYSASYDEATGAYSISNVKVMPTGTNYQFDAAHTLYLGNRQTQSLVPGANSALATRLKGGDANGDGTIELSDLTIVGGQFGNPVTAGVSPDINADGNVNILDLVLVGGNYGLSTAQAW